MHILTLLAQIVDTSPLPKIAQPDQPTLIKTALEIVFGVMGAAALIIITLAGFSFVRSMGEPEKIAKARQTIIYAAIGLAVAVVAEALVSLVLTNLFK